ncbi:glycosyltransferase 61 family protein [Muricoccus radiodurans]|uniref:glycosyltransferase 61 family protein n=1 Tax=Muricoccus radiodurans TaxID=2231721 RepID=UPI003CF5E4A8
MPGDAPAEAPTDPAGAMMSFPDIVVTPTAGILGTPEPFEFKGGPRWPDFSSQVDARHLRDATPRPFDSPPDPPAEVPDTLPEAIWCGPVCGHFGHAIADFGMRIAASAALPGGLPLLFSRPAVGGAHPIAEPPAFFAEMLQQLGADPGRAVLLRQPVRVGRLHVLPQAERLRGPRPSEAHLDLMDRVTARGRDPDLAGRTVFVSRSKIRADSLRGRIAAEAYLDDVLARAGVVVVHPEALPLAEQMRLYRSAGTLVFSEGSALHGLQLLGRVSGRIGVLLRRTRGRMAEGAVSGRFARVHWLNVLDGMAHGLRRDGKGAEVGGGVTVLDPQALLAALGDRFGLHLGPHWDHAAYREACLADVSTWLHYRNRLRHRTPHPEGDVATAQETARSVRLFADVLDRLPPV